MFSLVSIKNISIYNRIDNGYNTVVVGWTFNYIIIIKEKSSCFRISISKEF